MPSKRRQNQPQPAVHSDYDTENPAPVAFTLPTTQWTVQSLNEAVLKRYLPDLEYIVKVAPFTVIYLFSPETQQWEKSGCEGTLFLCRLLNFRHCVIVLNRKSLDNFVMELKSADDVELTNEYVILQSTDANGSPEIFGLWIYSAEGEEPSTKEIMGKEIQDAAIRTQFVAEAEEAAAAAAAGNGSEDRQEVKDPMVTLRPGEAQNLGTIDLIQLLKQSQVQSEAHINSIPPPDPEITANGQRLDLLKLFNQPQVQPGTHIRQGQTQEYEQRSTPSATALFPRG